jgi:hypothetical protein
VVDVQNERRELVMKDDVIKQLPVARAAGALLNVTPGLQVDNNGVALSPTMTFFKPEAVSRHAAKAAEFLNILALLAPPREISPRLDAGPSLARLGLRCTNESPHATV